MSIIQNIRDKYARFSVIAIAVALIGFILTDYLTGRGKNLFGGGRSNAVGSVNGKKIDYTDFNKKVDAAKAQTEEMYKQRGFPFNSSSAEMQAVEQTWNQEINRTLFQAEFDKLGMKIGKKERYDILYGPNAPDVIKKAGTDANGVYDPVKAKQQVDAMYKSNQVPKQQKEDFNRYIGELEEERMGQKYIALFTNSTNYPRWFVEKQIADNSLLAKVSMVKMLYTDSSFVDSTIAISDKEISDYVNKHKDKYKQTETRSINYVTFSAAPTLSDSNEIKNKMLALKPEFDTTNDVTTFLLRNGGSDPGDNYYSVSQLAPFAKDSLVKSPKNAVVGPFIGGNSFVFAKLLDTKTMPDSAKARHILIQTYDPQSQQQLMDDSVAKKRIDSIYALVKAGARFDSLAIKLSDDKGSGAKGGVLSSSANPATPYFAQGEMVKEFNDFSFQGKVGEMKVVKTMFGYHLIEILDQKNFSPHYKVAYLGMEIAASKATDDSAQQKANEFFGDSRDRKAFDATFEKTLKPLKITKGVAPGIGPLVADVQGVGTSRSFVKSIYAAKLNEVLKPERIGSDYVVAVVTEINEEGTQPVAKARATVEPILRNKKKAEIIKQRIGKITTLEAAAAAINKPIEAADSVRMSSTGKDLGYESKVRGAAFNPANKGKVAAEAIEGTMGVYVIRVENVSATPSTEGSVADQRKIRYEANKNTSANPIEGLKNSAKIVDKRSSHF